jgi:hypothetical protein
MIDNWLTETQRLGDHYEQPTRAEAVNPHD